ncbi:MAG: hypothetical protein CFE24_12395 [Flavobacterium sp. BFFFF2]|nr:MAG: hypothetical protein CFE24_12395 [Flavobacterium sp. BFFFF2]
MTLGEKLFTLRTIKNISHEKLSYELNVSKTAIIKWEQDKSIPNMLNLLKICQFFEMDLPALLENVVNVQFSNESINERTFDDYAHHFKMSHADAPELIQCFIDNQKQIASLLDQQKALFEKIIQNSQ